MSQGKRCGTCAHLSDLQYAVVEDEVLGGAIQPMMGICHQIQDVNVIVEERSVCEHWQPGDVGNHSTPKRLLLFCPGCRVVQGFTATDAKVCKNGCDEGMRSL